MLGCSFTSALEGQCACRVQASVNGARAAPTGVRGSHAGFGRRGKLSPMGVRGRLTRRLGLDAEQFARVALHHHLDLLLTDALGLEPCHQQLIAVGMDGVAGLPQVGR
jgi:hypothetical protein